MQPIDPIVGGQSLRIPSIHSPDYVPGVSGWSINIDGSAEFNDLTIRGEFLGAEFILNSNGAFFYDSAPALNHLTFSICTQDTTDPFGNTVLAGFTAYDVASHTGPVGYINMIQQTVFIGNINSSGVFQTRDDAGTLGGNSHHLFISSAREQTDPTINTECVLDLLSGKASQPSGSADAPRAQFYDPFGTSAVDVWISGSPVYTDVTGTPQTKQVPVPGTGWSLTAASLRGAPPCRYWREGDTVWVRGAMALTSATPAGTAFVVGAAYKPVAGWDLQQDLLFQQSSAGAQKGPAHVFLSGSNLSVNGLTSASVGDIVNFNFSYTLGHLS